jgi:hypothetical protein
MPKSAERTPVKKENLKAASQPWWMARDRPSFKDGSKNLAFKGKGAKIKKGACVSDAGAGGRGGGGRRKGSNKDDGMSVTCPLTPELCLATLMADGGKGLLDLFVSRASASCENMQFSKDEKFVIDAIEAGAQDR